MDYMSLLSDYRNYRRKAPIGKNAILLYFILMEYVSEYRLPTAGFTAANSVLQANSGLSRRDLDNARNELKLNGYIDYKKGSGGKCGVYVIVRIDTRSDTPTDTPYDTPYDTRITHINNICITNTDNTSNTKQKDLKTHIALFEAVWALYPQKRGKGAVSDAQKRRLEKVGYETLKLCIERYMSTKEEWRKYKDGSTFFNSGYEDFLDANFNAPDVSIGGGCVSADDGYTDLRTLYADEDEE